MSSDSHHGVVTRKMYSNGFRTMLRDKCLIQLSKTYSVFAHMAGAVENQQKIILIKKIDCSFFKEQSLTGGNVCCLIKCFEVVTFSI